MERLIVVFALCCQDNLVHSAVRAVSVGETVVLDCDLIFLNSTVVWLGQRWGEVPFIILTKENNIDRYFIGYDKRFSIVHDTTSNLSSLKICNITASDLGLFYCAEHFFKVSMVIGSSYNLTLTEFNENSTPPLTTVPHHPAACTDPGNLSKTVVTALISALVVGLLSSAGFYFYTLCRRPDGDKNQETDRQQNDQDEKEGTVQDKTFCLKKNLSVTPYSYLLTSRLDIKHPLNLQHASKI
nr:uncharacterized protein LOC111851679 [Paramormyrops kingsleyae]